MIEYVGRVSAAHREAEDAQIGDEITPPNSATTIRWVAATATGFLSVTAAVNGGGTVTAVSSIGVSFTPPLVGGSTNYGQLIPTSP